MTGKTIHLLLTGGDGQLGREILRAPWPDMVRIHAPSRAELDLTDPAGIARMFAQEQYAAVINAAAFTAVDQAETEIANAFAVNAQGPAILADLTREADIPLIHISTDYVFDGRSDRPYVEDDSVAPSNAYGASKLAGELAVLAGNPRAVVLRTAWLVSPFGRNFLKTLLHLSKTKETLPVVSDQIGNPTSAADLAAAIVQVAAALIDAPEALGGVYHFANTGDATWQQFAEVIVAAGGGAGRVVPIMTTDLRAPARRPSNSRLNTAKIQNRFGIVPRPWQDFVPEVVAEIISEEHQQ
jgi:dTDP-4-dehydrorhamnose reductase